MADSSLRILVVLPMYGGSLPIGQYCAAALAENGHSVRVFESQKLYPAYKGLKELDIAPKRLTPLNNAFLRFVSQAIWTMAQEQSPQIVLALAQAPLDRNLLQRMRQAGMRTVMWFVEDFRIFTYWQLFAPLYDAFAVIQKEPFLKELDVVGQKHAFYLPLAALPAFHKKARLTPQEQKEYGADISFLGAGYPNRRTAFRQLAGKNFKIWGSDWDGETMLANHIQRNGRRIDPEETPKIYSGAKININLHSSIDGSQMVSNGDFVNPRTFELAAMGAFQLVDNRSLLPELFAPDELAVFGNMKEFYEKIEYFLHEPEKRENFAKKARERVLRDHTYEIRMAALVEYMQKEFNIKPDAGDEAAAPAGLSPQLKKDIAQLAQKLGLAPDAAFDDVAAKLRGQSGELNDLECGILFLDEWRKQYGG